MVIGGGAGSAAAVAELRKQGFDGSLTLVSAENTVPYERPPLSKGFLLGTSGQVPVKDAAWYEQASVELILGSRATRLDLAARTVTLSGGAALGYDQLLLATGVRPRVLPGLDGDGVCYLRTGEDAAALRDKMTAAGHIAVLGGGFIGCEVAAAAIRLGKRATILEALPTLLHRALGPELGDIVAGIHRDEGVDVRTGQQVLGIRPRRGGVRISTAVGDLDADVLVVGVGTVPNSELAGQAGLPAGHGIEVDECFATAAPGIYAIGDVAAQHLPGHGRRVRVEHHDTALRHGRVAARNMLGHREPFGDVHWFWSDQFDHTISSAGLIPESDGTGELVIRGSLEQRSFSAFSLVDGDRVRAVISLNRPRDVLDARRLIARDHSATAGQLRDESLPLKRLAAPAVTAT